MSLAGTRGLWELSCDLRLMWTVPEGGAFVTPCLRLPPLPSPPERGGEGGAHFPEWHRRDPHTTTRGTWCTLAPGSQRELPSFSHHKPSWSWPVPLHACREFPQQKGMCRPSDLGNTQSLQNKLDGVS